MINLYLDCAFRTNFKVGESMPKGYILPKSSDLIGQTWHITTLKQSNVFPGVKYQVEDSVVVLMPTKQNSRLYVATIV